MGALQRHSGDTKASGKIHFVLSTNEAVELLVCQAVVVVQCRIAHNPLGREHIHFTG